jgi:asparagine synthase (glutamine-hydrolysing)
MCGIVGVLNLDQKPVSATIVRRMTNVVEHRGPDGEGLWVEKNVGFGHRRLSIIDLSPAGHQPMRTADGRFVLTYNGEIYNFQELRIELEALGYQFNSKTDSEVVLKAFHAWGANAVSRFNGMFAFAIYDTKKNELFLARDRYGIKPLYFYYKQGVFIFASEVKSIIQHPSFEVQLNLPALNEYFSFQNILSDQTFFKDVKLMPAGHTLSLKSTSGKLKLDQYWDFDFKDDHSISEEEALEETDRLFSQAVNRQLVSDVEIGSYLSGGIDSGAITSIAAMHFPNLRTFTTGFDLSSASGLELTFDEREKAEYLSYLYKTEHYEVVLKAGDMERVMPDLIYHLEDPRVGQSYPNYYVARLASKFVKVALSGTGGDELFAGYPWRYYRVMNNANSKEYADKYYRYWQRLVPDRKKQDFFRPELHQDIFAQSTMDIFHNTLNLNSTNKNVEEYVNCSLYFEAKTFLHGLLLVEDKLSMAHSLETRVPFLDNDLVDFSMRIPVKFKLRNLTENTQLDENIAGRKKTNYFQKTNDGKILLRKVLKKYVPESYTKAIKQGFSAPDASWFKGESIEYIRSLLYEREANIFQYLNRKTVRGTLDEHFSGKNNHRLLIWSLLNMEWWLKTHLK